MVHQSNAHVWVEAWDEAERLWRRYDPTPASAEAGGGPWITSRFSYLAMYIDYINLSISRIFIKYEGDSHSRLMEAVRELFTSPGASMSALLNFFRDDKRRIHVTMFAAAGICLVVIVRRLWRYRKKSRVSRSKDERLRDGFLAAMGRRGFVKKPNEGLEEFTAGVARALGMEDPVARAAANFVISFEEFYFKDTPITPPEFKRLEGAVNDIKRAK